MYSFFLCGRPILPERAIAGGIDFIRTSNWCTLAHPFIEKTPVMSIKGSYSDPNLFSKLANYRMPFGKHTNVLLIDLPLKYLDWFCKSGFPQSELGELMRIVHETKADGLEHFLERIRTQRPVPGHNTVKK